LFYLFSRTTKTYVNVISIALYSQYLLVHTRETSTWCHLDAISDLLKSSGTTSLHIVLVMLSMSNCCIERRRILLRWICGLRTARLYLV